MDSSVLLDAHWSVLSNQNVLGLLPTDQRHRQCDVPCQYSYLFYLFSQCAVASVWALPS